MDFLIHSRTSARKYGGKLEDYIKIHKFMDCFKTCLPDSRHRLFLHNTGGIYAATVAFGDYIVNSDGKEISVRDIASDHCLDDLRKIPTVEECVSHIEKKDFALFNSRVLGEIFKAERELARKN